MQGAPAFGDVFPSMRFHTPYRGKYVIEARVIAKTCEGRAMILALDIGGTKIAGGIVDSGSAHRVASVPTPARDGGPAVLDAAAALAKRVSAAHAEAEGVAPTRVAVSSAGVVDPVCGFVTSATDLIRDWAGTDLRGGLAERLGLPVSVLNDVQAHALGEAVHGRGRGARSMVLVAVGTGIGGGIVVDGEVLLGAANVAGHLGHVDVEGAAGLPCSCGNTGHLEAIASGSGIEEQFERATGTRLSGGEIARLADTDDPLADDAARVLEAAGHALGRAVGGLLNTLDPELVVLAGSVTRAGERWWGAVADGVRASAMRIVADTPVVLGALDNAALVGAAVRAEREDHA